MQRHRPKQPEAGAPEDKVTQEMIEAGLRVLRDSCAIEHPLEADRLVVEGIFVAMRRLERR